MRDFASLAAYIAAREAMPFAWGSNDCVTFAAGAIVALTGNDPLAGIGKWKSQAGAMRALAQCGGLYDAVSQVLREIPTGHAHRGDIGAVVGPDGPFLMVIEGMTLAGPAREGVMRHRRDALVKAWSAGA